MRSLDEERSLSSKVQQENSKYLSTIQELTATIRALAQERDLLHDQVAKHEEHLDRVNLIIFLNKLELLRVGLYQQSDANGNPIQSGLIVPRPDGPAKTLHCNFG